MNWDKLDLQKFAVKILKTHIKENRLASTYLLTGQKDAGKEELALAFACALFCESGKKFEECDCGACSRIIHRSHPDVRWLGEANVRSIKIEEIRTLINWAAFKPYEGKWKVFIVTDADRLTTEASNAFLKTLEEPAGRTIFCLLVESKAQLLETVQSRAFEIRLRPCVENRTEIKWDTGPLKFLSHKRWEECLDEYQSTPREELKTVLDGLMEAFRDLIDETATAQSNRQVWIPAWIKAFERTYESKDALDANANQKLVLSRLAMQLKKILPEQKIHQWLVNQ